MLALTTVMISAAAALSSSSSSVKLWSSVSCPYAQRARIALEETGVEYELKLVDLSAKSEEFVEVYAKANPCGARAKVPVLQVDDFVCTESMVVVDYLYENSDSLSKEQRAIGRLCVEVSPFTKYFGVLKSRNDPIQLADAVSAYAQDLVGFEKFLAKYKTSSGPFLFDDFSFVEANLAPFVQRAKLCLAHFVDVDLLQVCDIRNLPHTLAYIQACVAHPSVTSTSPPDDELIEIMRSMLVRMKL